MLIINVPESKNLLWFAVYTEETIMTTFLNFLKQHGKQPGSKTFKGIPSFSYEKVRESVNYWNFKKKTKSYSYCLHYI